MITVAPQVFHNQTTVIRLWFCQISLSSPQVTIKLSNCTEQIYNQNDLHWLTKSLNQILTLTLSRPCLRDLYSFFVNIGKSKVTRWTEYVVHNSSTWSMLNGIWYVYHMVPWTRKSVTTSMSAAIVEGKICRWLLLVAQYIGYMFMTFNADFVITYVLSCYKHRVFHLY